MSNDSLNPSETQDSLRQSNEIVTSWRDVDTSTPEGLRELDKEIARRRGFEIVVVKGGHCLTENSNATNPLERFGNLEYYTTDANAALALAYDTDCKITLETTRDPYTGKRVWLADIDTISYVETCTADTPALAVCLAYLAYSDAQQESKAVSNE